MLTWNCHNCKLQVSHIIMVTNIVAGLMMPVSYQSRSLLERPLSVGVMIPVYGLITLMNLSVQLTAPIAANAFMHVFGYISAILQAVPRKVEPLVTKTSTSKIFSGSASMR